MAYFSKSLPNEIRVNSLFDADLATFNKSIAFNQNASAGFIEIYNLPAKTARAVKQTL